MLIPILLDDFEGFKTSGKKVTAEFVEIAKELEVETKELTEPLQSYHKTWTNEELLLRDEQNALLRWNLHLVKMLEMTKKDLEYYINLGANAAAGF